MQEFVEFVIKGLVDKPEAVTVTPVERAGTTLYEVRVDTADTGRIIGRRGMTINAIRALVQAGSSKKGIRCQVDLVDEDGR